MTQPTINDSNFEIIAAKLYSNPKCIDAQEFYQDLNRFKYIKKLVNRYQQSGILTPQSVRLILNHLTIVFNSFSMPGGVAMLRHKMTDEHMTIIKPFLVYLKAIQVTDMTDIDMDPIVVEALREIRNQ